MSELDVLQGMSDRDLLITAITKLEGVEAAVVEIKTHQIKQNGIIAELKGEHFFMRGALALLAFIMVVGVAVAGVVLTMVTLQ